MWKRVTRRIEQHHVLSRVDASLFGQSCSDLLGSLMELDAGRRARRHALRNRED